MLFVVAEMCTRDKEHLKRRIIWAPGFEGAVRGQLARGHMVCSQAGRDRGVRLGHQAKERAEGGARGKMAFKGTPQVPTSSHKTPLPTTAQRYCQIMNLPTSKNMDEVTTLDLIPSLGAGSTS